MKKIFILTLTIISCISTYAQDLSTRPFIHVIGTHKLEVIPNEIEIGFTALEYKKKNEDVLLATIHSEVTQIIKELNIPQENLQIDDFYGARWMHKRRVKDLTANKRYVLKLSNLDIVDALVQKLDSINIQEITLEKISHTEIEKFKQNVKVQATKNAKEKAKLMTSALDQDLGPAFEIVEIIPQKNLYPSYDNTADKYLYEYESLDKYAGSVSSNKLNKVNFKTITLEYTVSVKFNLP